MFTHYKTEGIFLKKIKRLEADEFLIIYTKDFGRVALMGKSIKKISSKLRSNSELFNYSKVEFIKGRNYNILTDSILVSPFPSLKKDFAKLTLAFKIAGLTESLLKEEEEDLPVWDLLKNSFYFLDDFDFGEGKAKKNRLEIFYFYFSWNLLSLLGYKPEVEKCAINKEREVSFFSPREGGLICESCWRKAKDPLSVKLFEKEKSLLKLILSGDLEESLKEDISYHRLKDTLENYVLLIP